MEAFLSDYDVTYEEEVARVALHETRVVEVLEAISRSVEHAHNLPSQEEHDSLKSDLAFKTREMKNSKATAAALQVRGCAGSRVGKRVYGGCWLA